jgi:glycogen(starch) synthase
MRVLLPTMRDPGQIGGTSTHIAMLARGLEEIGHEAHPLYLGATIPAPLRTAGLIWPAGALNRMRAGWGMMYSADTRGRLLAAATAWELGHARKAGAPWEVLNAQEVYSVPYLRRVADEFGVPLVLTLHGYPLYESLSEGYTTASRMGRHYLMRAEMQALRLADAVVTVDTRLYGHALRLVPERADSVYTLMNFIDTSVFAPSDDPVEEAHRRREARAEWAIPDDKIVLFCPRRLVKKNGVIYPSLALAEMEPTDRDRFLLLHAGEGGEREEMEGIIRHNRLEKSVRLLGGQGPDAILGLYRVADIVLVPSVHSENVEEATSLSALEAMASGRPLIAGDVGGLAEMVVEGETGLLVRADAGALAAAILRLAAAPELGARMAATARRYVVENHSHLRAAAAYAEVYRRATATAGGAAAAGTEAPLPGGSLAAARPAATLPQPWPSLSVLGFPLDVVTLEQAARWVIAAAVEEPASPGRTKSAVSFNPELVAQAQQDPAAAEALLNADLCYPDGVGAVWAAGRQGARAAAPAFGPAPALGPEAASDRMAVCGRVAPERVAGIDVAQRVLELAAERGLPVYFLGAAEGVAEEAARRQAERLPGLRIAGTHHGYFSAAEEDEVVQTVRRSGARVLLVAMGAPRQEILLFRHRDELGAAVAMGVGGSLDVWAGTVKRAPAWTQRAKVEWLYRLASNPRRLRRQAALPRYAAQVVRGSPDDYGPPRRGRARGASGREAPGRGGAPGMCDVLGTCGAGAMGDEPGGDA